MQSFMSVNIATHIKILVESGIDNTSSNISLKLTTVQYYTQVQYFFLNHNTGTNFYTSIVITKYRRSVIGSPVLGDHNTGIPI